MQRLPQSETEVMLALWEATGPVPRSWLDERLQGHGWSINTVNTYLSRLEQKGFVECVPGGRAKLYQPRISREEYRAFEGGNLLDRLYGKSLKSFVAALVGGERVDEAQLAELQQYLDSLKGGGSRE